MSNNVKQALNSQAVPFFARFLEGQFCEDLSEKETEAVRGGVADVGDGIVTTLKFPSDQEDGGHGVTKKYRFDQEDGGYGFTKKYPSDADQAVTNKYPSDGDDHLPRDYFVE